MTGIHGDGWAGRGGFGGGGQVLPGQHVAGGRGQGGWLAGRRAVRLLGVRHPVVHVVEHVVEVTEYLRGVRALVGVC